MAAQRFRWRTRFGSWVRAYSVGRLMRSLEAIEGHAISRPAIYQWISGRTSPQPRRAHLIAQLSQGAITIRDVYAHKDDLHRALKKGPR